MQTVYGVSTAVTLLLYCADTGRAPPHAVREPLSVRWLLLVVPHALMRPWVQLMWPSCCRLDCCWMELAWSLSAGALGEVVLGQQCIWALIIMHTCRKGAYQEAGVCDTER